MLEHSWSLTLFIAALVLLRLISRQEVERNKEEATRQGLASLKEYVRNHYADVVRKMPTRATLLEYVASQSAVGCLRTCTRGCVAHV